jgi:carboxyl-terminal processing protease
MNEEDLTVEIPLSPGSRRGRNKSSRFITVILIFGIGLFVGRYLMPAGEFKQYDSLKFLTVEEGKRQLIFPTFWEAWDTLDAKFIGDLSEEELFYGAVEGMIRAAGDPYTVFAPPADTKQFEETIEGSFSGVGIEIGINNGAVTVISPLDGSPAKKAGILQKDIIIAVDEEPITKDMSIDDVVQRIRGNSGEAVNLTVFHESGEKPEDISIVRGKIEIESVKLSMVEDVAHLTITNFNGDTGKKFNEKAKEIKSNGAKGIILDVRNNPGGFLQTSVDIASRFLDKDQVVVSERGKTNKEYKTSGSPTLKDIPMVILVNGGSASASEILAGALNDHLESPMVGEKTFGKGSVQEFIKLADDSSLRVTVAKWYTPMGRSINEEGIEPTIEITQDYETEEDEQLQRAVEEIRNLIQGNQTN